MAVQTVWKDARRGLLKKPLAVKKALENGANPNERSSNEERDTPLLIAALNGSLENAVSLLHHGADPNTTNDDNVGVLFICAGQIDNQESGDVYYIARHVLAYGADPNVQTKGMAFSPMHLMRSVALLHACIEKGACLTLRNDAGQTPYEYMSETVQIAREVCEASGMTATFDDAVSKKLPTLSILKAAHEKEALQNTLANIRVCEAKRRAL